MSFCRALNCPRASQRLVVCSVERDQESRTSAATPLENQTDLGTTARLPSIATGANQVAPGVPQLCPAEARHIIRTTNIGWTAQGSLNFVALRLLNRTAPLDCLELDAKTVKSDFNAQNKLMLGILPPKVESAKNSDTFEWMVTRVTDGSGVTAPRAGSSCRMD